ncbi:cytochrome P450 [Gordonia jinghuaiqii]|nr:cytochrome P450 [Gordonia jinghuaiqii]
MRDRDLVRCPFPVYAGMREEAPVMWNDRLNAYIISRYEDIREVLRDPMTYSSLQASGPTSVTPLARRVATDDSFSEATRAAARRRLELAEYPVLINSDPPEHRRQRSLVAAAFTPRRIKEMEPHIQSIADELIDAMAPEGETDIVADFALPLPMIVIAGLLGVPSDMMHTFKDWTGAFTKGVGAMDLTHEEIADLFRSTNEFYSYFAAEIERRREKPKDDLIGTLLNARLDGETPLSDEELLQMLVLFLVAGNETTTNLISSMVYHLLGDPDLLARLRDDEELIAPFVEECLRLQSPTQGLFRTATTDTSIGGVDMPAGTMVFLLYASANRDEEAFSDPDTLDLDNPSTQHLAFGRGEHVCLGANIARREAFIAVKTLITRLTDLELAVPDDDVEYQPSFILRGLATLPIRFRKTTASQSDGPAPTEVDM